MFLQGTFLRVFCFGFDRVEYCCGPELTVFHYLDGSSIGVRTVRRLLLFSECTAIYLLRSSTQLSDPNCLGIVHDSLIKDNDKFRGAVLYFSFNLRSVGVFREATFRENTLSNTVKWKGLTKNTDFCLLNSSITIEC